MRATTAVPSAAPRHGATPGTPEGRVPRRRRKEQSMSGISGTYGSRPTHTALTVALGVRLPVALRLAPVLDPAPVPAVVTDGSARTAARWRWTWARLPP